MSRESLEKFFVFLSENKGCQEKVKSFGSDIDAVIAYAKELGYDISKEEFQEYQDKALQLLKENLQKLEQAEASLSTGAKEFYNFIKLADENEEVANRLAELGWDTPEELIAYGKEKGFTFNKQDMKEVSKNILEPREELSEEDLERVAGGVVLVGLMAVASSAIGLAVVGTVGFCGVVAVAWVVVDAVTDAVK